MKKKIISCISILIFTGITIYITITSPEIADFSEFINKIDARYLIVAIGCMLIYLMFNSIIIYTIANEVTRQVSFLGAIFLNFTGQYYSLVTPFASGGQPAQILAMKTKYNVSAVKGTTITVKKYIIYQMVVSLYATIIFLLRYQYIMQQYKDILIFIMIGVVSNLAIGIILIILAYTDVHVKKIVAVLFKLAQKLKLFKKKNLQEVNQHIDEYVQNLHEIRENKKTMALLIVLTVLQLTLFFSITYFIFMGLGYKSIHYLEILSIQTIVYTVASFIPTPGSAGASEGSFYILFKHLFPTNILLYCMTLWRIIVYYGNILVSGLILVIEKIIRTIKEKQALK